MNLATFRNFSADRMDIDELVTLLAFGKSLRAEYESLQLEEPQFVDVQLKSLRREITSRNADKLEARKRELTARLDALKTPSEKKRELQSEMERLDKQLTGV
jgi:hypothetical protein